jgi:LysM repeat protein
MRVLRKASARAGRFLALLTVCALAFGPAPARAARTHVVQRGETLSSIATNYNVAVRELARANKLKDADLVRLGQTLLIPEKPAQFIEHRVTRGESLNSIADRYGISVADIRAYNELSDPDYIVVGETLRIPRVAALLATGSSAASTAKRAARPDPRRDLPDEVLAAIESAKVTPGRWRHIVIHHSGTDEGSGEGMDRYHREERGMENGLAYHFVIGNGHDMGDGEIFIGNRWKQQLDGGHLAIPELNKNSLGICLVGDFQKRRPTKREMDTLEALVRALMRRTGLGVSAVTTHRLIHPRHTECPGKYFPLSAFLKRLKEP